MGIIRTAFSFMTGTLFGVYLAQNYDVPNIGKLANTGYVITKHIEQNYRRKPSGSTKANDDDDSSSVYK